MRYFGEPWDAPVVDDGEHAPTPVGQPCMACEKPIVDGDQGFLIPHAARAGEVVTLRPWHRWCLIEQTCGPEIARLVGNHWSTLQWASGIENDVT